MRVQLEKHEAVAARMMALLQRVAERPPAQCEGQARTHVWEGMGRRATCLGRWKGAGDGLLRLQGMLGR